MNIYLCFNKPLIRFSIKSYFFKKALRILKQGTSRIKN